jgi:hypothetical protein
LHPSATNSWSSWVTLAICLSCATVQLYWGGQDKQGQFHSEYLWADGNLGISLFFLGPYLLFAVSAIMTRRRRVTVGYLVLVAILCSIGLFAGWVEHDQYLRTPPGRETQPMLNFIASIGLWLGSLVMFVVVTISRFVIPGPPSSADGR